MRTGAAVTMWSTEPDFKKLRNEGKSFVLIRVGKGLNVNQLDDKFKVRYDAAKDAGLEVGVYHKGYAQYTTDAAQEAAVCLNWLNKSGIETDTIVYYVSATDDKDTVGAYKAVIERAGYKFGRYMPILDRPKTPCEVWGREDNCYMHREIKKTVKTKTKPKADEVAEQEEK